MVLQHHLLFVTETGLLDGDVHCKILGMPNSLHNDLSHLVKHPCFLFFYCEDVCNARPVNLAWEAYFKAFSFYSVIVIHKNSGQYVVLLWNNTLFWYLFTVEKLMGLKMAIIPLKLSIDKQSRGKKKTSSLLQKKDKVYYSAWEVMLFRSGRFTYKYWQGLLTDKSQNQLLHLLGIMGNIRKYTESYK